MRKNAVLLMAALLAILFIAVPGCGGGSDEPAGPSEEEVGAPVYPGARFESTGSVPSSYKYVTDDSSAEVVNWYRKELRGMEGLTQTDESPQAITGNLFQYEDGENRVSITVLPQPDGQPTSLDIFVQRPFK